MDVRDHLQLSSTLKKINRPDTKEEEIKVREGGREPQGGKPPICHRKMRTHTGYCNIPITVVVDRQQRTDDAAYSNNMAHDVKFAGVDNAPITDTSSWY